MVGILQWELSLTLLVRRDAYSVLKDHNTLCWICLIVLTVGFTSAQFSGSESSQSIEVIVSITGGSSSTPITVTVTPSVQTPVSAMGK